MVGARYLDRLSRRAAIWRIEHRTVVLDWQKTELWPDSAPPVPTEGFVRGARRPEDPSYTGAPRPAPEITEKVSHADQSRRSHRGAMSTTPRKAARPFSLGPLTLRNRIVGAPHGRGMLEDGLALPADADYWRRLAAGGAAMVTVGGTVTAPESTWRGRIVTEAWREEGIDGLAGARRRFALKALWRPASWSIFSVRRPGPTCGTRRSRRRRSARPGSRRARGRCRRMRSKAWWRDFASRL